MVFLENSVLIWFTYDSSDRASVWFFPHLAIASLDALA